MLSIDFDSCYPSICITWREMF